MNDQTQANETTVESEPSLRLRAGERIWLYRRPRSYVAAALTTLLALPFWVPVVRIAFFLLNRRPDLVSRDYNKGIPLLLFVWAFTSFMALLFWRLLRGASVRLSDTYLEFADWWGRPRRMDLSDIVAISPRVHFPRRGPGQPLLTVCQLTPGAGGGSRWVTVCRDRQALCDALLAELVNRCELTEPSPASAAYGALIFQRPGHEFDLPP